MSPAQPHLLRWLAVLAVLAFMLTLVTLLLPCTVVSEDAHNLFDEICQRGNLTNLKKR
jgi:hypothetical protein